MAGVREQENEISQESQSGHENGKGDNGRNDISAQAVVLHAVAGDKLRQGVEEPEASDQNTSHGCVEDWIEPNGESHCQSMSRVRLQSVPILSNTGHGMSSVTDRRGLRRIP